MPVSPPKEAVEPGDATPDRTESMERGEEAQVREAYDFEVKEQDRWLPIANGWSQLNLHAFSSYELRVFVLRQCMMMALRIAVASGLSRAIIVGFLLHSLKICASIMFL